LLLQKIIQRTGLLLNHLLHLPNIVYRNTIYTTLSLDKLCGTFMIIMADDVFFRHIQEVSMSNAIYVILMLLVLPVDVKLWLHKAIAHLLPCGN